MAFLNWLAWVLRILWAVRISVINVVLSLLVFGFAVQAQNLMADLSSMGNMFAEIVFWLGVFAFTFLLWAFPVHYGARRTLDDPAWVLPRALYIELKGRCADQVHAAADDHRVLIRWLPRILGLMPFVALALGIGGALSALEGANDLPETMATRQQAYWLYGADAAAAIAFVVFVCFRTRIIPADWTGRILHPAAMVVTAVLFAIAYVAPIEASVILPRALLVPPLFGSLVLFLSWLQRLGHRTGFPFLTVLTVTLAVATGLNVDFNRIRTLPAHDYEGESEHRHDQRLTVMDAFGKWKAANPCRDEKRDGKDVQICPRPIIIAIDGGASRAAFTAATFIGDMLDRVPAMKGAAATPGRRIFAMSGVSGGSYGAAVVRAALADSQAAGPSAAPPCRSAQSTWFGFEDWKAHGKKFTWRQCLQALTSGDNLSATIIGLAFRDFMAPPWQAIGLPAMPDRAALLEMTFERQYSATLAPELRFFEGGDVCGPDPGSRGLCLPAAHPEAFFKAHGNAADVWVPMLLLNGTSVATGRRIISSDFKPAISGKGSGSLYAQAYDLREAMSKPCDHEQSVGDVLVGTCDDEEIRGRDVRLSTAAVNSARFPLISPAGIFDMRGTTYGDQIVDGGYFENSGLTTAMDIVRVLEANEVKPILVSISNDPVHGALTETQMKACAARRAYGADATWRTFCTGLPRRPAPTPRVLPDDNTFVSRIFGILSRPFQALVATGNGHGDEALGIASKLGSFHHLQVQVKPQFNPETWRKDHDPTCDAAAHKKVQMANVSMSWWLAASAQADLDIQRCSDLNQNRLSDIIAAAEGGSETSP